MFYYFIYNKLNQFLTNIKAVRELLNSNNSNLEFRNIINALQERRNVRRVFMEGTKKNAKVKRNNLIKKL